jgi:hypothetical protein
MGTSLFLLRLAVAAAAARRMIASVRVNVGPLNRIINLKTENAGNHRRKKTIEKTILRVSRTPTFSHRLGQLLTHVPQQNAATCRPLKRCLGHRRRRKVSYGASLEFRRECFSPLWPCSDSANVSALNCCGPARIEDHAPASGDAGGRGWKNPRRGSPVPIRHLMPIPCVRHPRSLPPRWANWLGNNRADAC